MNPFVNYIIEAGLSLGVFTIVYWFILRGETRFKATRFYLLFSLLFSTLLPFMSIKINSIANEATPQLTDDGLTGLAGINLIETVTIYASNLPSKMSNALFSFDYSMMVYRLGAFAALFIIAASVFQLFRVASSNRIFKLKGVNLVISSKAISPYSFFNYIFIARELTEQENWKTMVHHEIAHVKQGHSFDVLFIDFMMVFQWFNPFYWVLRRLVRENHEFLADTDVLAKGLISNGQYKKLLLSQAIGGHPVITSNFFNVKTVKKRFKMMTKNNNRKFGFLKYTLGVISAIALTLMFACEDSEVISTSEGIQYIYDGKVVSIDEVDAMNINYIISDEVDKLEVVTAYPELSKKIKDGSYIMLFDMQNKAQVDIMKKLELKPSDIKINNPGVMQKMENDLGEDVFIIVEEMPEYEGGEAALRQFLADNIKYPEAASENGIQGRVYIQFVVEKDGTCGRAKVVRGVDPSLDAEALRVVNTMPKWQPGKQRGQNVAVAYTIPVNFQLQ
ncbi:MAG TPA: M56 family metallopeptidase [Prolixibacteraceae bacterium]|nr:M56 family metallopeptidase [Prolixibacteraceae bacterium]